MTDLTASTSGAECRSHRAQHPTPPLPPGIPPRPPPDPDRPSPIEEPPQPVPVPPTQPPPSPVEDPPYRAVGDSGFGRPKSAAAAGEVQPGDANDDQHQ